MLRTALMSLSTQCLNFRKTTDNDAAVHVVPDMQTQAKLSEAAAKEKTVIV